MAFGRGPLSHPLLVEAMQDVFVPLAVNNRKGKDGGLLARYEEPAFNNPVVRYFTGDGKELLPRRDGVWGAAGTAARMVAALEAGDFDVPPYLARAHAELAGRLPERAVFGMHCFWQGQAALGRLEGVLSARPGWLAGGEVVEVFYDPRVLGFDELVEHARSSGCASRVFVEDDERLERARDIVGDAARHSADTPRDAKPSDDLYHLERSPMRFLPLTPLQALRVNGELERRGDPSAWLSPRQRMLAERVRSSLADDGEALSGLERPRALDALADYGRRLLARLDGE